MTQYVWKKIEHGGVGSDFSVAGRIVHVSESNSRPHREHTIALVELPETQEPDFRAVGSSDPEGVTDPTCAGKDGECSRKVDEEGDRCWQHPEDE